MNLHSTIFRLLLNRIKQLREENNIYILLYLDYYLDIIEHTYTQEENLHSTIFRLLHVTSLKQV